MSSSVVQTAQESIFRIGDYLPEIEYRLATTRAELEQIYQLRYKAYLREGEIDVDPSERFTDFYDRMNNCWIFGVYAGDELVSSVRMHVISKKWRHGPALDVFPDIVGPMIDEGRMVIDPTRFVADRQAKRRYPELAYVTLRAPSMACVCFDADYCLATVKAEYQPFYERIFQAKSLCEPRPYPALRHRIALMLIDVARVRDGLMTRHNSFHSAITEWQTLFRMSSQLKGIEQLPALNVQMPELLAS
ncbi:MAG: hypothetical protein VYD64_11720 [Pseudomonadota bacterium]|nr:hypothetical protein [Pseudomonadota bacterium]